ncbi:MAG: glycosyltransferase [Candidatus Levybacteria bacterium]|nr:glycosyltransferase [Candidatus Levybacteria bacterium]
MRKYFVSIIIPTYNAQKFLDRCLKSIRKQDYPKNKYEILVIDGGSTDNTIKVAKKWGTKILKNQLRDAERGKAIGIKNAKGEIIALIDADNELVEKIWLTQMLKPLKEDRRVFGVESPWLVRKNDSSLNQYFALLRIADPLARKLHPRANIIEKKDYLIYELKIGEAPVIGANGFLYRKNFIDRIGFGDRFEEVNFVSKLVSGGLVRYAVPKNIGIYHHYVSSLGGYVKKRIKIGKKFMARKNRGQETWVDKTSKIDFFLAVLYNLSIVAPLIEAIKMYNKSKNPIWFWHPIVSFLTIVVYVAIFFLYKLKIR